MIVLMLMLLWIFIKKMLIRLLSALTTTRFGKSLASNTQRSLNCVSLNNRSFQATLILVDIDSNVGVNLFGGCLSLCVPNKVKNMNVKVFNLMSDVKKNNFQFSINRVNVNVD